MLRQIALFIFIVSAATQLFAMDGRTLTPEDQQKIINIVNTSFSTLWNENNCQGLNTLYTSDSEFVNIRGGHFFGATQIEERHQIILNTFLKASKFSVVKVSTRYLIPHQVVDATVFWQLTNYREPDADNTQAGVTRGGVFTHILVKDGDDWKITKSQNSLIPL